MKDSYPYQITSDHRFLFASWCIWCGNCTPCFRTEGSIIFCNQSWIVVYYYLTAPKFQFKFSSIFFKATTGTNTSRCSSWIDCSLSDNGENDWEPQLASIKNCMSSYHKYSTGHVCPNGLSRRIQSETANVCLILQSTRIFFRFIFVLPFCLYGSLREWMQIFVALQVPRQQHDLTIFFELKSYSDDLFNCTNTSS